MHAHRAEYAAAALVASAWLVAVPHLLAAQPQPQSPPQVIKTRKDNFKILSEAMRDLVKGLATACRCARCNRSGSSPDGARTGAGSVSAGSDEGDTKALPRIWTEPDQFAATYGAARECVDAPGLAATGDDGDAFGAAVGRMAAACGACHAAFRAR